MTRVQEGYRLKVQRCDDGRRRLVEPLHVDVSSDDNDRQIVEIPAGKFVTDYSSLPFGTRWVVHWSRVDVAGVVHDYMYRTDAELPDSGRRWNRWRIDRVWRMIALSGDHRANCVQAWVCWLAMLVGGCASYQKRPVDWDPTFDAPDRVEELAWLLVAMSLLVGSVYAFVDWEAIKAALPVLNWPALPWVLLAAAIILIVRCNWPRRTTNENANPTPSTPVGRSLPREEVDKLSLSSSN